jgi:hypothetical protein
MPLSYEYVEVLKSLQLAARDNLALLESGSIRRAESHYGGQPFDITKREIQRALEEVAMYRSVLADHQG